MRAVTSHGVGMTLFTFTPLQSAKLRYYWYLKNRSYGTLKSCEREQSGTSTVGRCGTQGGPPGRMILAQ